MLDKTPFIALLAGILIGSAVAWNWQGARLDAVRAEYAAYRRESEHNAERTEAVRIETETRWKKEAEDAKSNAKTRQAALLADIDSGRAAADKLRHTVAALQSRLASASTDACPVAALTSGELLTECAERYRDMAEAADRHADDLRTLTDAWPK